MVAIARKSWLDPVDINASFRNCSLLLDLLVIHAVTLGKVLITGCL